MELKFYYNDIEKATIKYNTIEKARDGFNYYKETLYKFSRFNKIVLVDDNDKVINMYKKINLENLEVLETENITYEQAYQKHLDITFIMKYTENNNSLITEVSGFYYGEPNQEDFEIYKNKGVVSVVDM